MACNCGKNNSRLYYLICPACGSVRPQRGRKEELVKKEKCFNCGAFPIEVRKEPNVRN